MFYCLFKLDNAKVPKTIPLSTIKAVSLLVFKMFLNAYSRILSKKLNVLDFIVSKSKENS